MVGLDLDCKGVAGKATRLRWGKIPGQAAENYPAHFQVGLSFLGSSYHMTTDRAGLNVGGAQCECGIH